MRLGDTGLVDRGHRVAAADHRERGRLGHRARQRHGAGGERRLLEDAHRAVPHDRLGALEHGGEALDAQRAEVQPHLLGRDVARPTPRDRDGLSRPAATTASTGSTICTPRRRAVSSVERAISMRSTSTQRLADTVTERAQEGEGHAAADERARRPSPSRCSTSAILSETLAPPSTAASGRSGACEDAPQRLQLALHQQAGRGWLQVSA